MKNSIYILFASMFLLAACGGGKESAEPTTPPDLTMGYFGDKFEAKEIMTVAELTKKMEENETMEVTLEAEIVETCTKKGCWMDVVNPNGENLHVTFKDYGFFVPTGGMTGKKAVMTGVAYRKEVSQEELDHLAEDAGKEASEIEAGVKLTFEATGVMIKDFQEAKEEPKKEEAKV